MQPEYSIVNDKTVTNYDAFLMNGNSTVSRFIAAKALLSDEATD